MLRPPTHFAQSPRASLFLAMLGALLGTMLAIPALAAAESGNAPIGTYQTAASRLASGDNFTCAIRSGGILRCWGHNQNGQLGLSNMETVGDNEHPDDVPAVDLGTGRTAIQVAAGAEHTCVIVNDGSVRCWGRNGSGQLGRGNSNYIGLNDTPNATPAVNLGVGRTATALSAGNEHTCALLDNGAVRCWGVGSSGQLGLGNTDGIGDDETPDTAPTINLGAGRTATAIASGQNHTCAILDTGDARCWGINAYGQLGLGNTNDVGDDETPNSVPSVNVGAGRTVTAITAGEYFTCALLDNASLRCWGANWYGQLGQGNGLDIGDDETVDTIPTVNVGAGRTVISVATGNNHVCAILDNDSTRCWGYPWAGQLGVGPTTGIGDDEAPEAAPTVNLGPGRSARAITGGSEHSCAILDTGDIKCWGNTSFGQLGFGEDGIIGNNEPITSSSPVELGAGRSAVSVVAGGFPTCAVLDNGSLRCWGFNGFFALGQGPGTAGGATVGDNELPDSIPAINLGTGRTASSISANNESACAILDGGDTRCWGNNGYGQLGLGHTDWVGDDETPGASPTINLGAGRTATGIAAGAGHTCALLDTGDVRCWGYPSQGAVGLGTPTLYGDDETPDAAPIVNLGAGRTATQLVTGGQYNCAILDTGDVRCWGDNSQGQLGLGSTTTIGDNETPNSVPVVNLGVGRTATKIATGSMHACAILDDGNVRCWGRNSFGQLGIGSISTIGDDETPDTAPTVNLGVGRTAVDVSAGGDVSCAILDNNETRCWGYGASGALGLGSPDDVGDDEQPSSAPTISFGAGRHATSISTNGGTTCAVLDNGDLRCWGDNMRGALGSGIDAIYGDIEDPAVIPNPTITEPADPILASAVSDAGSGEAPDAVTCSGGNFWFAASTEYQWYRNGSAIAGATGASHAVTTADDGATLTCRTIATTAAGTSVSTPSSGIPANSPPSLPTLSSDSHTSGSGTSSDTQIRAQWLGAIDSQGIAGYAVSASNGATDEPGSSVTTTQTSGTLTAGVGTWYVHVRARDTTGRWTSTVHLGPFNIVAPDITPPTIALKSGTITSGTTTYSASDQIRFTVRDTGVGIHTILASSGSKLLTIDGRGTLDASTLPEGKSTITIVATDLSGNKQTQRLTVTIDRTAPKLRTWTRHTAGPKVRAAFADGKGIGVARTRQLSPLTMGASHVRMRVSDKLGNTRTVSIPVTRHISLSKPWLNHDAQGELGYSADLPSINAAFRFVGYTEPWYAFAQRSNPLVAEVQRRLHILGIATGLPRTGRLDIPTLLAVRKFQRENGISDIATVGPQTRAALDRALNRHLNA